MSVFDGDLLDGDLLDGDLLDSDVFDGDVFFNGSPKRKRGTRREKRPQPNASLAYASGYDQRTCQRAQFHQHNGTRGSHND